MEPSLTYSRYLAPEGILGAQRPRRDEPDEMLFIVVHQVYELWFKEMLLDAGNPAGALHTLRRILTILKVAVAQVDVLETMTPRQSSSARSRRSSAGGTRPCSPTTPPQPRSGQR